jgi:glucose-6-phosphate isomerase
MKLTLRQTVPISQDELSSGYKNLAERVKTLKLASEVFTYQTPENFLAYVADEKVPEEIANLVLLKTPNGLPKTVFVIGIGGANLATKAIYDACEGYGEEIFDLDRKMVFLDTVDVGVSEPVLLRIESIKSIDEFVVVIVSKSGKTLETLANAEFLFSHLENKFGPIIDRIVVVSTESSPLWADASFRGISCVSIPESLSDRFSAFSPTTLVPLALYGFLIPEIIDGGKDILDRCLSGTHNNAIETAVYLNSFYKKGFNIYDLFFFTPRLEVLGKWQTQLIAESLGKEKDLDGKVVHTGLNPKVSIGTTDLHSNLQLTLAGPKERITAFVSIKDGKTEAMGDSTSLDVLPQNITSKSMGQINSTILTSVQEIYLKDGLPYFDIQLEEVSARSIGEYMMFAMLQTVFLGALWNINVFDQPNVEGYKERVREMLK